MSDIKVHLPSDEKWSHEKVMQTMKSSALAQWSANEPCFDNAIHAVAHDDIYMIDEKGNKFLDASSQAVCTNLGYEEHTRKAVADAVHDQILNQVSFAESRFYVSDIRAKVIEQLKKIMPEFADGGRFYFLESGATAVEAAMRMARTKTGRPVVVSTTRGYHGSTGGAITCTGGQDPRHWGAHNFGDMNAVLQFLPFHGATDPAGKVFSWGDGEEDSVKRWLAYLDQFLTHTVGPNRLAAVLLEDCVGTMGGGLLYPAAALQGVAALTKKHSAIFICDCVMSGFARTGGPGMFCFQRYGLKPDMCIMAKGLTSAYAILSSIAVSKEIGDFFDKTPVPTGQTYNCHPTSLAAAYAILQLYESKGTLAHVNKMEPIMTAGLQKLADKHGKLVQAARNTGLHGAIEIAVPSELGMEAQALVAKNLKDNRIATVSMYRPWMQAVHVFVSPPLIIRPEQISALVAALDNVVAAVGEFIKSKK